MKSNYISRLLYMIIVLAVLTGCSEENRPVYTASNWQIIDSIYKKHLDSINLLFSKLSWLETHPDLDKPLIRLDSLSGTGILSDMIDDSASVDCKKSDTLSSRNCIIINNRTNLIPYGDRDSSRMLAKTNYFITEFYRDYPGDELAIADTYTPGYWNYYNKPGIKPADVTGIADSLYPDDATRLKQKLSAELSVLGNIKYAVLLSDKLVSFPKLLDNKTFESGYLFSTVKVFEISTRKLLCSAVLETYSSDQVEHIFGDDQDALTMKVLNIRLIEDFCDQRNKKVVSFLKNRL